MSAAMIVSVRSRSASARMHPQTNPLILLCARMIAKNWNSATTVSGWAIMRDAGCPSMAYVSCSATGGSLSWIVAHRARLF